MAGSMGRNCNRGRWDPRRLGSSGLTLAELATTVSVGGVLLLVLVPVLSRLLQVYELRGAAQRLYADFQRARVAAIAQNNRFRLVAVAGSGRYVLHDDDNSDDVENDGTQSLADGNISEGAGIEFGSAGVVSFAPNGTALAPATFTLRDTHGGTRTVTVESGGRIRVQ